jgi:ribosomal protein L11 methylase PrmA
MSDQTQLSASFRDPSGFLFSQGGEIYRQVNLVYQQNYDHLLASGLYDALTKDGLLIPHDEIDGLPPDPAIAYKILRPQQLGFISYPYEWSFSQLKDAALATLALHQRALEFGMVLKDASAYNIQFDGSKPVMIDTLSFEIYNEGDPWVAYRQFCQHFLAPLALMAYLDVRLSQFARVYIDGIPLDLATKLLPRRTRFNPGLAMHIHMHASAQQRYADKAVEKTTITRKMSKTQMLGLIDNLEGTLRKLRWQPAGTEWADYYEKAEHYSDEASNHKREIVKDYLERIRPQNVWDLGANVGTFSRVASKQNIPTIAFDIDPGAVERNYLDCKAAKEKFLLPLISDLTNPSPSLGWHGIERMALLERGPADAVMALALIHHLAISNNVPLPLLATFFADAGNYLIIEFVPKDDPQVELLLATREDIFSSYDQASFEAVFSQQFKILDAVAVQGSKRKLYLMEKYT